jgi:hypothetical protein
LGFLVAVVVVVIIDCLWFLFKGRAERLSESLKAPLADDVLERDKRPPILYLRSFEDDTSLYPDHERDLVAALAPFGPVIAIGRPGEFLQTLGAARAYCGDDWKEQVRHWIDTCALVVIRIGESQVALSAKSYAQAASLTRRRSKRWNCRVSRWVLAAV